jgi:hypothetical protein
MKDLFVDGKASRSRKRHSGAGITLEKRPGAVVLIKGLHCLIDLDGTNAWLSHCLGSAQCLGNNPVRFAHQGDLARRLEFRSLLKN